MGRMGPTGPPGRNGGIGATGPPGARGNAGPRGEQGAQGSQGAQGNRWDADEIRQLVNQQMKNKNLTHDAAVDQVQDLMKQMEKQANTTNAGPGPSGIAANDPWRFQNQHLGQSAPTPQPIPTQPGILSRVATGLRGFLSPAAPTAPTTAPTLPATPAQVLNTSDLRTSMLPVKKSDGGRLVFHNGKWRKPQTLLDVTNNWTQNERRRHWQDLGLGHTIDVNGTIRNNSARTWRQGRTVSKR